MMASKEFFHADFETNFQPLPVSWYVISSSLWQYFCACIHMISILDDKRRISCNWVIVLKPINNNNNYK